MWLQTPGLILGAAVLLEAFTRFVIAGVGMPAPAVPTEWLVVGGLYRYAKRDVSRRCRRYRRTGGRARAMGAGRIRAAVWRDRLVVRALSEESTLRRQFGSAYGDSAACRRGFRDGRGSAQAVALPATEPGARQRPGIASGSSW